MTAITTHNGRTLQLSEGGDPSGFPVIAQHGTPSSRLLWGVHDDLARGQGVRLIGYDRPGYGGSTRVAGPDAPARARDGAAIAGPPRALRRTPAGGPGG